MNPLVTAASNLPKLSTGIGSLAWLGFFLATAGLALFYRCSKYILTLSCFSFFLRPYSPAVSGFLVVFNINLFSEDESLKNDVYTASAYGDLEKLHRLVECEGCSVSEPDGLGYYALQWAALNNRSAVAQYIIEHGGDINATDHTGQTASHWSAVRGAVQVAELLLQEGARVDATDIQHMLQHSMARLLFFATSSQSGMLILMSPIMTEEAHCTGRAAYKGFADSIRLLLFLDAYRGRQDKEGCTPLHWAAIRGNLEACTVLVQAGKKEDLMITDNTRLTPAQLAAEKNHRQVSFFLGNARRLLEKRCDGSTPLGKLSKLGLAPVLWFMILLLLLIYTNSVILGCYLCLLGSLLLQHIK
ncbi:hypothetical protein F2Q68_00007586 [Brassica cretica]|uniref:protein S-acyltransferase n=1 Tax=Brassica cretica TaxID=69181 RepID=A0A8S9L538_BRACR|nr:hypothetical protein F2Q68_00007586 [Brassica cretica]